MILDPPLLSNMWIVLGILVPCSLIAAGTWLLVEKRIEAWIRGRKRRR